MTQSLRTRSSIVPLSHTDVYQGPRASTFSHRYHVLEFVILHAHKTTLEPTLIISSYSSTMRSLDLTELNLLFEKPRQIPNDTIPKPPTGRLPPPPTQCRQEYEAPPRPTRSNTGGVLTTYSRSIWGDAPLFISDIRVEMRHCPILTEQAKYFINDFQHRSQLGSTWIDVKMHFSVCEKPVQRRTPSPTSCSPALNPHATPFVSTRSSVPAPLLAPNEPAWFTAFCAGTQGSCVTSKFGDLAHQLAHFREWDSDKIMELAKYFCWKGGEGMSLHQEVVADFAKEVRIRFAATWYGEEFVWKMREYAITAFKTIWTSVSREEDTIFPWD